MDETTNKATYPQFNQPGKQNKKSSKVKKVLITLLVILLIIGGPLAVYVWQQNKVNDKEKQISSLSYKIKMYDEFSKKPNQACLGLTVANKNGLEYGSETITANRELLFDDSNKQIAEFNCTIGINSKDLIGNNEVAEIDKNGYELGISVKYFENQSFAQNYAQDNLEPKRYWSWDGYKATKTYISFVNADRLYFDSYAVKENAVLRMSLQCKFKGNLSSAESEDKCLVAGVGDNIATRTVGELSETIESFSLKN